jgi:hypothetical protein
MFGIKTSQYIEILCWKSYGASLCNPVIPDRAKDEADKLHLPGSPGPPRWYKTFYSIRGQMPDVPGSSCYEFTSVVAGRNPVVPESLWTSVGAMPECKWDRCLNISATV